MDSVYMQCGYTQRDTAQHTMHTMLNRTRSSNRTCKAARTARGSSCISNDPSFRQKHPGVPDGSDGSDGTSYPLTENYTLPVALQTYLLYCVVTYKHHQNDTCGTLFAVAAVMLKRFTQHLVMFNSWRCLCLSPAAASLVMLLVRLEIIATTYCSMIFKTYAFSLYSHLCIYVSI